MTIAATQLEEVLAARFAGIRFGRYNCRRIAGSNQYSQHSWPGGNARDLYAPVGSEDPDGFLNVVVDWLEANAEALSVRLILWQVKGHYSHAHVDFWPQGYGTPPCDGGGPPSWLYQGKRKPVRGPDPGPQNGLFEGDEMPRALFESMIQALFNVNGGVFKGNASYWIGKIDTPEDPEWADFWTAYRKHWEKAL